MTLASCLVTASCSFTRAEQPTAAARSSAGDNAERVTTTVVRRTTTTIAPEREHWKLDTPCARDGGTVRGGNAIVATWDRSVALDCGVVIDTATGGRRAWLELDDVVTLADRTVLGARTVPPDATSRGGREYVTVDSTGRPGAVWGVLPREMTTQANVTWLPVLERGYFVGVPKQTWTERNRASAASPQGSAPGSLRIYDSATGDLRTIDPAQHLATDANDVLRWWVVDGQLLVSSQRRGVTALRPSDLSAYWSLSAEIIGGALVASATDFGRLGVLPIRRSGGDEVLGLDVRAGSVLLSPRSADVVDGDVQFAMVGDYAVLHQTQLFVNNGFATSIRDGQKLWSYPQVKGPCDFTTVPATQPTGVVMACGSFVAYQRA